MPPTVSWGGASLMGGGEASYEAWAPRPTVCLPEQQYETPLLPSGCIFKLVFVSSWGDAFYVGLNGVELLSERDESVSGRASER